MLSSSPQRARRSPAAGWRRCTQAVLLVLAALAAGRSPAVALANSPQIPAVATIVMGAPVATQFNSLDLFKGLYFVPGLSASRSFVVHNATHDAGMLSLALDKASADDPTLLNVLQVNAHTPNSTTLGSAAFSSASSCPMLISETPIAAGGEVTVIVSVSMEAGVGGLQHATQLSSFDFIADMHDARSALVDGSQLCASGGPGVKLLPAPGTKPGRTNPSRGNGTGPSSASGGTSGGLAWTGQNILLVLIVGMSLLAGGSAFIVAARRRSEGPDGP